MTFKIGDKIEFKSDKTYYGIVEGARRSPYNNEEQIYIKFFRYSTGEFLCHLWYDNNPNLFKLVGREKKAPRYAERRQYIQAHR